MQRLFLALTLLSILSFACAQATPQTPPTVAPVTEAFTAPSTSPSEVVPSVTPVAALPSLQPPAGVMPGHTPCGDGVCQGPENAQNCAVDCALTPGTSPFGGEGSDEHRVTNPASGAALFVQVFYPAGWDGQTKLPALVLVPGGSGDSGAFLKPKPSGSSVEVINQAGYVAVVFDPDGRGQSDGTEDYNGFIHQDGLAEVIRFASTLPDIDSANIGLVTYSYGITMGAGALARHPDLPVKFLIDWEGPANRDDTGGCDSAKVGHLKDIASCTHESFWAQREASTFIAQIRVPYQRLQSEKDHVQPDNAHAILMVNNAVNGGVPWVRLNNDTPNQTYDPNNPPAMLPDNMLDRRQDQLIVQYAQELLRIP